MSSDSFILGIKKYFFQLFSSKPLNSPNAPVNQSWFRCSCTSVSLLVK
ncbi:MAG: hypothetical protein WCG25_01855 [bacterium]